MKKHLIVYAKRPLPGYAKTRLGSEIGLEESAGVYARLLYSCLLKLIALDRADLTVEVSLAASEDCSFFRLAFPEFRVTAQEEGDLGQRFTRSFADAFARGAEVVVVIGTDIPDLDPGLIETAFSALAEKDIVIGPDMDGGYYLIGTRIQTATLFRDIDWSSALVFQQTARLLKAQMLTIYDLPMLSDVDTEADYQRWLASRVSGGI